MKDATGELSMTAIAVVAIAAIGVVFTTLIWPNIKATIQRNTNCSQAYNCEPGETGMQNCTYLDQNNQPHTVVCPAQEKAKID